MILCLSSIVFLKAPVGLWILVLTVAKHTDPFSTNKRDNEEASVLSGTRMSHRERLREVQSPRGTGGVPPPRNWSLLGSVGCFSAYSSISHLPALSLWMPHGKNPALSTQSSKSFLLSSPHAPSSNLSPQHATAGAQEVLTLRRSSCFRLGPALENTPAPLPPRGHIVCLSL